MDNLIRLVERLVEGKMDKQAVNHREKVGDVHAKLTVEESGDDQKLEAPFTVSVMVESIPNKITFPKIDPYDGMTDPGDFLSHYQSSMSLMNGCNDTMLCRGFITGLRGIALSWFRKFRQRASTILQA